MGARFRRARLRRRLRAGPGRARVLNEASRIGIGTYAPHDPTTADIADLVGSVDLAKVAQIGDEGDPARLVVVGRGVRRESRRAGNDRDFKVKREFLYLLLT